MRMGRWLCNVNIFTKLPKLNCMKSRVEFQCKIDRRGLGVWEEGRVQQDIIILRLVRQV